jgi:hypothetical protein
MSAEVTLTVPEPVVLRGEAVNGSRTGILVEARGRLGLRVTINGREYRGWLARAYRVELNAFAYAIELDDALEVDDLR